MFLGQESGLAEAFCSKTLRAANLNLSWGSEGRGRNHPENSNLLWPESVVCTVANPRPEHLSPETGTSEPCSREAQTGHTSHKQPPFQPCANRDAAVNALPSPPFTREAGAQTAHLLPAAASLGLLRIKAQMFLLSRVPVSLSGGKARGQQHICREAPLEKEWARCELTLCPSPCPGRPCRRSRT